MSEGHLYYLGLMEIGKMLYHAGRPRAVPAAHADLEDEDKRFILDGWDRAEMWAERRAKLAGGWM